jgi:hypothetical protein
LSKPSKFKEKLFRGGLEGSASNTLEPIESTEHSFPTPSEPVKTLNENEERSKGPGGDKPNSEPSPKIDITKTVDANSETSEEGSIIILGKRF